MEKQAYKRIIAVGDIHGYYDKFCDLDAQLEFKPQEDLLVFLGDYTDRGPDSWQMMEWVKRHWGSTNVIFLRGNHEQMFWDAFRSEDRKALAQLWLYNGGRDTIRSLEECGEYEDIETWLALIEKMPKYLELEQNGQKYIFAHAGIKTGIPMAQQSDSYLLWKRDLLKNGYPGPETVIVGHTPVQVLHEYRIGGQEKVSPAILCEGHFIMVDTGSYMEGGVVSGVDVLTGMSWSSHV